MSIDHREGFRYFILVAGLALNVYCYYCKISYVRGGFSVRVFQVGFLLPVFLDASTLSVTNLLKVMNVPDEYEVPDIVYVLVLVRLVVLALACVALCCSTPVVGTLLCYARCAIEMAKLWYVDSEYRPVVKANLAVNAAYLLAWILLVQCPTLRIRMGSQIKAVFAEMKPRHGTSCVICVAGDVELRCDPCGHASRCFECGKDQLGRQCSICRTQITGLQRVIYCGFNEK